MKKIILVIGCVVLLGIGSQSYAALGDSDADLVYTPVTPCRIIDTRGPGTMITTTPTNFVVAGTTGFEVQGGQAGGCGIPTDATAVSVNFIAVSPQGPGNLRAWPYGVPEPTYCSIINYAAVTGLNIANGVVEPICDSSVTTCTSHLTVRANVSSTHMVADVTGYFSRFPRQELHNPLQVALLRWYDANKAGVSFSVGTTAGSQPTGVAFDGMSIWVANSFENTVRKVRASDGANLGTFNVGTTPYGIAFDGAHIWVVNSGSNDVTKLRAGDGFSENTYSTTGTNPIGIAFDGANIWLTNQTNNNVVKLRASDGAFQGSFPAGNGVRLMAFDGANIWVANYYGNNVSKLRASDGANLGDFAVGTHPFGVAFDGANIWVGNQGDNTVTKLRASDGANLGTFNVGTTPWGIAFDGGGIWVTNLGSNNVTKLRARDGANLGTFNVGTQPMGVAFDGANIWVGNFGSGTVSKK